MSNWVLTREMFLSEQELGDLLGRLEVEVDYDQPATVTDRLIVNALVFSGLRNTEFCRLAVENTIIGTKKSVFDVVGTPRQDRRVFVPQCVSELVKDYAKQVRPHIIADELDPKDRSQPILLNERGRPYERTALYRRVVRILKKAGLGSRASVQLFRHTYGYLGYKNVSGNLLFLQKQMGHAHPMVTSVYAQFVKETYQDYANQLAEPFI